MKNSNSNFTQLVTRAIGRWVLILCYLLIAGVVVLGQNNKTEPDSTYGSGGKRTTWTTTALRGQPPLEVELEEVHVFDPNGVLRESYTTHRNPLNRVFTLWQETVLNDCKGRPIFYRSEEFDPFFRNRTHFKLKKYKDGKQTYGYESDKENGKIISKEFDPKTRRYEKTTLEIGPSDEVRPERDTSTCSESFKPNEAVGFFSLIREDSDPAFNTYGGGASYTRFLNPSVGLTADFNANFRTQGGADLSKISFLGGLTVLPVEGAKTTDNVTFSTHALFGVSHFKSDAGAISFTDNAFTMKLGGAVDVNVTDNFFIRPVQIDYAPTFFGDTAQHNVQFSFGAGFRFGGK